MMRLARPALFKTTITYDAIVAALSVVAVLGCRAANEVPAGTDGTHETSAGTGGTHGGGDPSPYIEIQANTIADGTTNAGPGPFPVTFYAGGRMLDAATLADLVSRLQLTTWPEGTAVPVRTTLETPPTDGMMATAQVSATDALANRWYALRFGPPADGVRTQQTFDGGVWGVRFRPDSHPAVLSVGFCGVDAEAGMKFIVSFSEEVTVDAPATALTVRQNGAAVTCELNSANGAEVHQYCAALTPGLATVSLEAGTVHGASGSVLPAHDWTVDIAQLPDQMGCRSYRVPLAD